MDEIMGVILALMTGGILGAVNFASLWWTVQKGVSLKRPAPLFVGSLLMRTSIVLAGFYFIGRGGWQRMLLCLLGFVIARHVVMRLTRAAAKPGLLER